MKTTSRLPMYVANWKMYKTVGQAQAFAQGLRAQLPNDLASPGPTGREMVVCPPFTALAAVGDTLRGSGVRWGAQDLFWESEGAFTGEISPGMLQDVGCSCVIIGHSERRQHFAETDHTVHQKLRAALAHRLTPILCVGESLQDREREVTFQIIARQIKLALHGLPATDIPQLVIAYEPVWAIGTGKTATPVQAEEVHAFIRKLLGQLASETMSQQVRILYGGSIKPNNTAELMQSPNIDGGLVGGASLDVTSFLQIAFWDHTMARTPGGPRA